MSDDLNRKALARAEAAGASDRVTLLQSDFMDADVFAVLVDLRRRLEISGPDLLMKKSARREGAQFVIAMYLLQDALYRLQPSIEWYV